MRKWLDWRLVSAEPLQLGDLTVTPQSRVLTLNWTHGGFVWNRPAAVLVQRNGQSQRVPIGDPTRTAQWLIAGGGALLGFIIMAAWNWKRRDNDEN
jgi:hypothetical protein